MPIVFAAIAPHPPIIVPGIGKTDDVKKVKDTIKAMDTIGKIAGDMDLDTLLIISPHALVSYDKMNVYGYPKFYGDFGNFGKSEINFSFENDVKLAKTIVEKSNEAGVNAEFFGDPESDYGELDHGEMVPLYYLNKYISGDTSIIPIAYSHLNKSQHFTFGQIINDVSNLPEFKHLRIGILASGDMSHRLIQGAPIGYKKAGIDFDKQIVELISQNKVREIMELDDEFIEEAGECGYRSILILLGSLDKLDYKPEIISYEGPFGVGYMVVNFELPID